MKKLVTWISKARGQFRSKINLGMPSDGRIPSQTGQPGSEGRPFVRLWRFCKEAIGKLVKAIPIQFEKFKLGKSQEQQAAVREDGVIERLNQKYLKIPQPFAAFLKPLVITVSIIVAYALFGFYLLPAVLKSKIPSIIQEETGRKASVANIEFNPFKLIANIQGFKIEEKNGKPFVGFYNFVVDVNGFQSIGQLALVIDEIALNKPNVHLAKQKDGKFNFEDMAKPKKKKRSQKKMMVGYFQLILSSCQ